MARARRHPVFVSCFTAMLVVAGCSPRAPDADRPRQTWPEPPTGVPPVTESIAPLDMGAYAAWARQAPVAEFDQYLVQARVAGVVATPQLLRTATDWKKCGGPEFEIPPRDQWPQVQKVLTLVSELKQRKIVVDFEAVSNFRNPQLNACAGGAKESSHTKTFAIDIIPRNGSVDEKLLCDFWRTEGKQWDMGLSKYPSGRIHLDTTKYRTWGFDHRKGTSFCG